MSDTFLNQMTKEYNPVDVAARQATLRTKWEKSNLLKNLNEGKANVVAQLLENQAIEAKNTMLRESSQTGAIAGYNKIAFPLVRRVFGQLLATELVSVQPMSLPAGLLFFLDFKYDRNKSGGTEGGSVYGNLAQRGSSQQDGAGVATGEGGFYAADGTGYSRRNFKLTGDAVPVATNPATKTSAYFDGATVYGWVFTATDAATIDANALSQIRIAATGEVAAANPGESFRGLDSVGSLPSGSHLDKVDPTMTTFDGTSITIYATADVTALNDGDVLSGPAGGATTWDPDGTTSPDGDAFVLIGPAMTNIDVNTNTNEFGDFEATANIPEIDIAISSIPVSAVTRKLKATWTPELAQDISAYHAIDAEVELITVLSDIISTEVDREILGALLSGAAVTAGWSRMPGKYVDASGADITVAGTELSTNAGFTGTNIDWYQTLMETINAVSNEIHRRNLRSGANWMVTSPDVATILESMAYFKPNASFDPTEIQFSMGIEKVGSLSNRYTVYKDPYFPAGRILLGYKGAGFLDAGFVYAPYVPLVFTPTIFEPNDFTPRKGAMTRYASQMVRPEYYAVINVYQLGIVGARG